ncbi:SnoaL-like domain-containing protein [Nocardioides szechwanensis]|uniref:SnoaL-like domain-containing protein n=1 Tax=Nocardioides szechwanensis TaxID=1005944 RepID=A0A1H0A5I8_9ACTN|nr:nuclear transport factor 2 family protein [Nocardioides szechwanensis]SDN28727.1 SnoaL-like domain-containing protein [Nocardioides szechwanensis]
MSTLEQASDTFYRALNTMLTGDVGPMLEVWSHADDVTYMSPFGELLVGWEAVRESWEKQAAARLGGQVAAEELRCLSSSDLGFVVGCERGSVEVGGVTQLVDIRATSMYRLEGDRWAMIGHHTDPLS